MVARYWLAAGQRAGSAFRPNGAPVPASFQKLKKRSEFLAVSAANRRWATPGLVLQVLTVENRVAASDQSPIRLGFTATKKVGNAVIRNRARRRLRAAASDVLKSVSTAPADLVLVARQGTLDRPFPDLKQDLEQALRRLRIVR